MNEYMPPAPGYGPREGQEVLIDFQPVTLHDNGHRWIYLEQRIGWREVEGIEEELAYPKFIGDDPGTPGRVYSDGLRFYCTHCLQVVTLWTQRPGR